MVRAFDTGVPPREDYELVTVTVNQNLFDPTIQSPNAGANYQATVEILETRSVNNVFFTVVANDVDTAVSLLWHLVWNFLLAKLKVVVVDRFYTVLFSALEQTYCASMWFYMSK